MTMADDFWADRQDMDRFEPVTLAPTAHDAAELATDLLILGTQVGLDDDTNIASVAAQVLPHRKACGRQS